MLDVVSRFFTWWMSRSCEVTKVVECFPCYYQMLETTTVVQFGTLRYRIFFET